MAVMLRKSRLARVRRVRWGRFWYHAVSIGIYIMQVDRLR